jgi:ribonuclease Z
MNLEKRRKSLYIYGPDAERFVSDILDLDYWGPRFKIISVGVPYEGDEIKTIYHTKDFEILSTPVRHTVPAVAYCFKEKDRINVHLNKAKEFGLRQGPLIGKLKKKGMITFRGKTITLEDVAIVRKGTKLVYSGDTKSCETLAELAKDADVLIHDATFMDERKNRMHTGAGEAGRIAKNVGVKKLILTHFSRRYIDPKPIEDEAKKKFKNTIVAKDFLRLKLKHK